MYQTRELAKFISTLKVAPNKKIRPTVTHTKSNKIIQLYEEGRPELDISNLLYGSEHSQNFRKLKSRMIQDMANNVISFVDNVKLRNKYDEKLFGVQRLLLLSNLLIIKDKRDIALPLLRKAFKTALSIEYTPYTLLLAKALCYSSAYAGDKKKINYYTSFVKTQIEIYRHELEIEMAYFNLFPQFTQTAEYTTPTKKALQDLYKKLQSLLSRHSSYNLTLLFFRIGIRYYHSINDFQNVILICQKAIQFYINNSIYLQNARIAEFALYEIDCCLRLQVYSRGNECAKRCLKFLVPYSSPWSVFNEYYFLLAMRTGNYKKAESICNKINESGYKLNKMLSRQKDKWKIYEAFLQFVSPSTNIKQFNLYKYLNEISLLGKDKKGYNFLVLLSKILLLIRSGNYNALIEMEESFMIYFRRYIKLEENPRHFYFGKFLLNLFKQNYDLNLSKHGSILTNLKKQTFLEETEIIPYENLINLILTNCEALKK